MERCWVECFSKFMVVSRVASGSCSWIVFYYILVVLFPLLSSASGLGFGTNRSRRMMGPPSSTTVSYRTPKIQPLINLDRSSSSGCQVRQVVLDLLLSFCPPAAGNWYLDLSTDFLPAKTVKYWFRSGLVRTLKRSSSRRPGSLAGRLERGSRLESLWARCDDSCRRAVDATCFLLLWSGTKF